MLVLLLLLGRWAMQEREGFLGSSLQSLTGMIMIGGYGRLPDNGDVCVYPLR